MAWFHPFRSALVDDDHATCSHPSQSLLKFKFRGDHPNATCRSVLRRALIFWLPPEQDGIICALPLSRVVAPPPFRSLMNATKSFVALRFCCRALQRSGRFTSPFVSSWVPHSSFSSFNIPPAFQHPPWRRTWPPKRGGPREPWSLPCTWVLPSHARFAAPPMRSLSSSTIRAWSNLDTNAWGATNFSLTTPPPEGKNILEATWRLRLHSRNYSQMLQRFHVRTQVAETSELPSSCTSITATSDNHVTSVEHVTRPSQMEDGEVPTWIVRHKLSIFRESQPTNCWTKWVPIC